MFRIHFKNGVDFQAMHRRIWDAVSVAAFLYQSYGALSLWVTSGREGEHMVGSLHHDGKAVDIRAWNLPKSKRTDAFNALKAYLGTEYDVIDEGKHIHIEYDVS